MRCAANGPQKPGATVLLCGGWVERTTQGRLSSSVLFTPSVGRATVPPPNRSVAAPGISFTTPRPRVVQSVKDARKLRDVVNAEYKDVARIEACAI